MSGQTHAGMASGQSNIKEAIRAKLNIADVVSAYVQLRRSGKGLVGLCPFHQEKTPSFHVDPVKGLFYCFGCKEGGDLFDFVMKVEGLEFPAALALVAEKAGINIDTGRASAEESRQHSELIEVSRMAQSYFRRSLAGSVGRVAREYLVKRGLQPEVANRFGIGFAPDSWNGLARNLIAVGKEQAGITAGLLAPGKNGGVYDRFRGRVMFPLMDSSGKVVAFGGRSIDQTEPKYLNSPETPLYVKRKALYGFYQAKDAIRRHKRVIVVEGYFDCLALHQHGVDYAVASCGTALSREHIQLLCRLARDIYICFDGDTAGRTGIARGWDVLQGSGLSVRVVSLPDGQDPDSLLRSEGREAFLSLLERALPLPEYLLEQALAQADLQTVEGRMRGVRAALPVLQRIASPVERDAYLERVAVRLRISPQSLAEELNKQRSTKGQASYEQHTNWGNRNTSRDFVPKATAAHTVGLRDTLERELLRSLIADPCGVQQVRAQLGEAPFSDDRYNAVLRFLAANQGHQVDTMPTPVQEVWAEVVQHRAAIPWQECLARMRLQLMREELEAIEEGLAKQVDHNPEHYALHLSESLLAFRRWRKALREHFPGHTGSS